MAYTVFPSSKFKKDFKKYQKQESTLNAIRSVMELLAKNGHTAIPQEMKPHKLSGNYKGYWECHILPDLLLIWEQEEKPNKKIYLLRAGSHSNLF